MGTKDFSTFHFYEQWVKGGGVGRTLLHHSNASLPPAHPLFSIFFLALPFTLDRLLSIHVAYTCFNPPPFPHVVPGSFRAQCQGVGVQTTAPWLPQEPRYTLFQQGNYFISTKTTTTDHALTLSTHRTLMRSFFNSPRPCFITGPRTFFQTPPGTRPITQSISFHPLRNWVRLPW